MQRNGKFTKNLFYIAFDNNVVAFSCPKFLQQALQYFVTEMYGFLYRYYHWRRSLVIKKCDEFFKTVFFLSDEIHLRINEL